MKVLQVNDIDIYGRSFNGYDIAKYFNKNNTHEVKQLVITKLSKSNNVIPLYKHDSTRNFEYRARVFEQDIFSVHSMLSATSYFVNNSEAYSQADIVHFHQVHNTHLNLRSFEYMAKTKPTVMSFHDPWPLTGHCVHPAKCDKWQNGCLDCPHLNTIFEMETDHSGELWKIKEQTFAQADIDVIVHSKFMLELVKKSHYGKNLNVHLVNLGIDLNKYNTKNSKEKARKLLNIPKDSTVLFFRAQKELKGTEYIVEALKGIETSENIVLLSCSQTGLLTELEDKFKIIEMGNIDQSTVITCFNACDIFLMPSLGESFGIMAIEAMASGKPVVVFNNTALPTVTFAPECGILVNDRDSDDLREKIKFLLANHEERQKRGELGRKLAEENYDINNFYKQISEVYAKAYERQKYKLSRDFTPDLSFDKNDIEVKKLFLKLHRYIREVIPFDSEFEFLKDTDYSVKETNDIDFANENVQRALVVFNTELSRKIEAIDNKMYNMSNQGFRRLKIYKKLISIPIINAAFEKIKAIKNRDYDRYSDIMLELKKLRLEKNELEKKLEALTERVDKNDKQ